MVITIFFITSGDSGSLVVDVLAYGGRTDTPKLSRMFWTVLIAITAIVLLAAAQDPAASLRVLQVASISAAAPLSIVYALAMLARSGSSCTRVARQPATYAYAATRPRPPWSMWHVRKQAPKRARPWNAACSLCWAGRPTPCGAYSAALRNTGRAAAGAGARKLAEGKANDDLVLAIEDVPAHATTVDTDSGVLGWNREDGYRDPLSDASFETPEYAESYEGWEHRAEEYFDETVATGTIPVIDLRAPTVCGRTPRSSLPRCAERKFPSAERRPRHLVASRCRGLLRIRDAPRPSAQLTG